MDKESIRDALDKALSMYPMKLSASQKHILNTMPDGRMLSIICPSF